MSDVSPVSWPSPKLLSSNQAPSRLEAYPTRLIGSDNLLARLRRIINNTYLYRQLLRYKDSNAQALLDLFQSVLDSPDSDAHFRRSLIIATQRLSRKSSLYPVCYQLKEVRQIEDEPVTAGGFADIYKGEFEGQVVCLKVIRLYQDRHLEHLLKQFSKEVILWGQLSHINVLPMYGLYRFKKRLCLVAPWMENGDLQAYLQQNPKADRSSLTVDVTQGLNYLHKNDIVHGDLKGPNILIDAAGRARVSDFGIACISDPDIVAWTSLSSMSSKGGSLRWQAPELFDVKDNEAVKNSIFSDIYALGCVFYEIYSSKIPFHNISRDTAVMHQIQHGRRPLRPAESSSAWQEWGLTEVIWNLIEKCWSDDPSKRPIIEEVINSLCPQPPHKDSLEIGPIASSIRFRRRMSEPLDDASKTVSEKLLNDILGSKDGSGGSSTPHFGQERIDNIVHCSQCHTSDSSFWSKNDKGQTVCNMCDHHVAAGLVNKRQPVTPASVVLVLPSPKRPSLVISPPGETAFKSTNLKEESDETIQCICGSSHDDGFRIVCDRCSRRCHAACFGIAPDDVTEEWKCWGCDSTHLSSPSISNDIQHYKVTKKRKRSPDQATNESNDETSVLTLDSTTGDYQETSESRRQPSAIQGDHLSVPQTFHPQNADSPMSSGRLSPSDVSSYGADDEASESSVGIGDERIEPIGRKEKKRRRTSIS